jgi:hypothetical protein
MPSLIFSGRARKHLKGGLWPYSKLRKGRAHSGKSIDYRGRDLKT